MRPVPDPLSHSPRHSLRVDLPSASPSEGVLLLVPRLGGPTRNPATALELKFNYPYRNRIPTPLRFGLISGCD